MPIQKIPDKPFDKLALSCSGGGYRAASFHLGSMSYLNRLQFQGKPLLENVRMISTVSGGTITGAIYALKKQEGKQFDEIYRFIMDRLHTLDLVRLSIEKLNPDGKWNNPFKRRNLINAFAELYDEAFTEGATFEVFSDMRSHLEAVVFNSTDFSYGLNFRFRNPGGRTNFGNKYQFVNSETANEVKVADAIASSACFPGGFEPMVWPDDFVHTNAPNLQERAKTEKRSGIMDGGVFDNQGIDSILNYKSYTATYKDTQIPYFDLVIVSDVSSPDMPPFIPYLKDAESKWLNWNIGRIKKFFRLTDKYINLFFFFIALLFALLPLLNNYPNTIWTGICLATSGLSIFVIIIILILRRVIRKVNGVLKDLIKKVVPVFYQEKLVHLKIDEIRIGGMIPLVIDRLNSLKILLSEVFLKIVRRLNYYKLYEADNYAKRRIGNLIKQLTRADFEKRAKEGGNSKKPTSKEYLENSILIGEYDQVIGSKIEEIAEQAAGFGTTLWFTEEENLDKMLDKLVATGQFTMCFNMLEYLEILLFDPGNGFEELDQEYQLTIQKLYKDCCADWHKFRADPIFMVNGITTLEP